MADEKHLKILGQGVETWNAWRQGNPGTKPDLSQADLSGANLIEADFSGADFFRANLSKAMLTGANFNEANLGGARLIGAWLDGANLSGAVLRETNFIGAFVDSATTLAGANVRDCIVDRQTLDSMKDDGGLTKGALSRMDIRSDVADLRLSFSGMRLWLHLLALLVFLFPYCAFIAQRYFEARFIGHTGTETLALWSAIGRYIWNGGQNWQVGWHFHWTFITFVALCIYNICRWLLLSKTVELEHRQEVSGLPVRFFLEEEHFWRYLVKSMNWLFWIGLIVVALNTAHFLTQEIPITVR